MPKARYREIVEHILQQITEGKLAPGCRIKSIREICDHYGVSSIVALRVFKELSDAGVVEKRNGAGYFVAGPRGAGQHDKIICLFRPLRDYNQQDNFGNRVIFGIMEEALFNGLNILIPQCARFLSRKIPSEKQIEQMADEISRISDASGLLVDMRIDDEMLKKYIIPAAGGIPVCVVGRQSRIPYVMSSTMPHISAGRDAASLAMALRAEYIVHFSDFTLPDSGSMTETLLDHLIKNNISREHILLRNGCDIAPQEECIAICDEIISLIRSNPGKVFISSAVDSSAQYLLRYVTEAAPELRAGKDYTLVGFGGYYAAENAIPRLATFVIDAPALGREAVKLLMQSGSVLADRLRIVNYKLDFNDTI